MLLVVFYNPHKWVSRIDWIIPHGVLYLKFHENRESRDVVSPTISPKGSQPFSYCARNSENKYVPFSAVPKTTTFFTTVHFPYRYQRDYNDIVLNRVSTAVLNSVICETIHFQKCLRFSYGKDFYVRAITFAVVTLLFALFVLRPVPRTVFSAGNYQSQVDGFGSSVIYAQCIRNKTISMDGRCPVWRLHYGIDRLYAVRIFARRVFARTGEKKSWLVANVFSVRINKISFYYAQHGRRSLNGPPIAFSGRFNSNSCYFIFTVARK